VIQQIHEHLSHEHGSPNVIVWHLSCERCDALQERLMYATRDTA
jgi:hypothetical protein